MSYKKLKKDLIILTNRIAETEEVSLLFNGLDKIEILIDLRRFVVFIEELEQKIKKDSLDVKSFKEQFIIIRDYLEELKKELDEIKK